MVTLRHHSVRVGSHEVEKLGEPPGAAREYRLELDATVLRGREADEGILRVREFELDGDDITTR